MTREEAINVLKTKSCTDCFWGCDSPVKCFVGGCDLAEATEIAIEALEAQGWIPTKERLPDEKDEVLVTTSWGDVCMAWCDNGKWRAEYINEYDDDEIVAWMPLPEVYRGERDDK